MSPLFRCQNPACGIVENSALSPESWSNYINKKPVLCSECSTGNWHGRFPKNKEMPEGEEDYFKNEK